MAVVGAIASSVAALIILSLGEATNTIDTGALSTDAGKYVATEPLRALIALGAYLPLAFGGAEAAARIRFRGMHAGMYEGPVIHAISRYLPNQDAGVWVTLQMRDGTRIQGSLRDYSWKEEEGESLLLWEPIWMWTKDDRHQTDEKFLLIDTADVLYLSGRYVTGQAPVS